MHRTNVRGGAGLAGAAGLGTWVYRTAPAFWKQCRQERSRHVLPPPRRPNPWQWPDRGLHAAWLGHSTVLLKIDGFTILTDPVLGTRVGLNMGLFTLGLKRLVAPALVPAEIPRPDLILLSHAHFDHFDTPTLRRLENRRTEVITAARTAGLLRSRRYRGVHELGWNGRLRVGPAEVHAFKVNHWGARVRRDTYRGYNGYTIEVGRYRVLFGGDTAFTREFRTLKTSRPFDLAIMPIGAYNPWIHCHCTPEQALQMANDAGSEFILPVHHQTFRLGREPNLEPIERLLTASRQDRVALRHIGQEFQVH